MGEWDLPGILFLSLLPVMILPPQCFASTDGAKQHVSLMAFNFKLFYSNLLKKNKCSGPKAMFYNKQKEAITGSKNSSLVSPVIARLSYVAKTLTQNYIHYIQTHI